MKVILEESGLQTTAHAGAPNNKRRGYIE